MLESLAREIPLIRDENEAASAYWDVYTQLVRITPPAERQKIMRLMAADAWLECAAIIAQAAFPALVWTARSRRSASPPIHTAALFDGPNQVADAVSHRHEGDALLLAVVRHAVRAQAAQKASA